MCPGLELLAEQRAQSQLALEKIFTDSKKSRSKNLLYLKKEFFFGRVPSKALDLFGRRGPKEPIVPAHINTELTDNRTTLNFSFSIIRSPE